MRAFVLALGLWLVGFTAVAQVCAPNHLSLRGDWGEAAFTVEIADTGAARAKGLMFRESLPRFSGMLFIYEKPQRVLFWMKNTLLPLDMLFIDKTGTVRRIFENAVPGSLATIDGGPDILAVLEINGGLASSLGINAGSQLQHPAFGPDAAWPCNG